MAFDLTKPVTVNGETFQPHELSQTKLLVHGVQPTDYEDYTYVGILAQHRNIKSTQSGLKAGGNAQAEYRYHNLDDLVKFHEYKYPYILDVVTAKTTDKKGKIVDAVLFVDFSNVQEMELKPIVKKSASSESLSITPKN